MRWLALAVWLIPQVAAAQTTWRAADLDPATRGAVRVQLTHTAYDHDGDPATLIGNFVLLRGVVALPRGVAVEALVPALLTVGDRSDDRQALFGSPSIGAWIARPLGGGVRVGGGARVTVGLAEEFDDHNGNRHPPTLLLVPEGNYWHGDDHVVLLHAGGAAKRGPWTFQLEVGGEHHLRDVRDQTLLRTGAGAARRLGGGVTAIAEWTVLTDVLDEEYDEGYDFIHSLDLGGRWTRRGWSLGLLATLVVVDGEVDVVPGFEVAFAP